VSTHYARRESDEGSLGVAWFAGGAALAQVWLFIIGPIVGAVIAGATYAVITGVPSAM